MSTLCVYKAHPHLNFSLSTCETSVTFLQHGVGSVHSYSNANVVTHLWMETIHAVKQEKY